MSISFVSKALGTGALGFLLLSGYGTLAQENAPAEDESKQNATSPSNPSATNSSEAESNSANQSKSTTSGTTNSTQKSATSRTKSGSENSSADSTTRSSTDSSTIEQPKAGTSSAGNPTSTQSSTRDQKAQTETNANDQFRFNQPAHQPDRDRDATNRPTARERNRFDDSDDRPQRPSERDFEDDDDAPRTGVYRDRDDFEERDSDQQRYGSRTNERSNRRMSGRERDDNRFEDDDATYGRNNSRQDGDRRYGNQNVSLGVRIDVDDSDRLIVRERFSSGLLARANLRPGDVIVSVGNQPVYSSQVLLRTIRDYRGNGPVPVIVLRDGSRQTIYVNQVNEYYTDDAPEVYAWEDEESAWLGVYLNARYPNSAVVQAVHEGSAADQAGLQPNDWIVSLNGQRIMSPRHLSQVIRDMEPGSKIDLQVSRRVTGNLQATLTDRVEDERPERAVNYDE